MAQKVFFDMAISLDGFTAPEGMDIEHFNDPEHKQWLKKWMELQAWIFPLKFFRKNVKLEDSPVKFFQEKAKLEEEKNTEDTVKLARSEFEKQMEEMLLKHIENLVTEHFFLERSDRTDTTKLVEAFLDISNDLEIAKVAGVDLTIKDYLLEKLTKLDQDEIVKELQGITKKLLEKKIEEVGLVRFLYIAKAVVLQTMDESWTIHLESVQDLREGIGLRGYAQRDPLVEYKNEAFTLFDRFILGIDRQIASRILKVREVTVESLLDQNAAFTNESEVNEVLEGKESTQKAVKNQVKSNDPYKDRNIGRNDPCPCGSG
jgi:preprotein translocase subunit SecA